MDIKQYPINFLKQASNLETKLFFKKVSFKEKPILSIYTPTFNRFESLKSTIHSVLQQNFEHLKTEYIIIDNSFDQRIIDYLEYLQIPENLNLYYYSNKNNYGMTGNWNLGVTLCSGEWVNMLHDDDEYLIESLLRIEPFLSRDYDMLITDYFISDRNKFIIKGVEKYKKLKKMNLLFGNPTQIVCTFIKNEVIQKAGKFDQNEFPTSDYDYLFKAIHVSNNPIYIKNKLFFYRQGIGATLKLQKRIIFKACFIRNKYINNKFEDIISKYALYRDLLYFYPEQYFYCRFNIYYLIGFILNHLYLRLFK